MGEGVVMSDAVDVKGAAFLALAQNAYEVMMRRRWGVCKLPDGWGVWASEVAFPASRSIWGCWFGPDPFTALVEADRWYRENVEKE